ncbi:polyprenyl synthetase family protein [Rhodococcus yananensis]|uniref:polyprenyl synthetase family protein n=1 Tax=Rhodococcus yananensis TaxID=2879464 RepID=UPI001CF831A9|nr:polyprenyl synthetase family protein [Rhodococcus sp. (in: high G+C Gram-positive bacteria)]
MSTGSAPVPVALQPEFVEDALRQFFESRAPIVTSVGGGYRDAVTALEAFVLRGGKRVRPSFAWTGWIGAGGDPAAPGADSVLRACSALELVQAGALIHDDIIDASTTRRGFATVHMEYADRHRSAGWRGDPADFGEAVAIILGDLSLVWADDMLRESGLDGAALARVSPVWSAMRTEVLGGQFLDIAGEVSADESVEAATRVNRYKTAAYTIERPLHIGAVLAGADDALVDAYRRFGTDIGLAFQLRDDLLGVFGDPEVTGKPSGDDLRAGKRTVLFAAALEAADATDRVAAAVLRDAIGSDLTDGQVEELRELLIGLGAVDRVEERITALTERAFETLDASSATDPGKALLRDAAVAATRRIA